MLRLLSVVFGYFAIPIALWGLTYTLIMAIMH